MNIDKEYNDYLDSQKELVEAHVLNCHTQSLMPHVSVAGELVNNKFDTVEDYMKECKSLHINKYEMLAEKYFRARMIYYHLRSKQAFSHQLLS